MKLKKLIEPPIARYNSLVERGKFNLMWNISLFLIPVFIILLLLHIVLGDISWTTSLSALLVAAVNLVILKNTRKYEFVGWMSVILGILICQISIFYVEDSRMLADAMWCLLIAFFTFFLFGNLIGTIVLLINVSGLVFYQFFALPMKLMERGVELIHVDERMIINVYYVAFALAFIISRMQKNNEAVNKRYEEQIKHNEILFKEVHHRVKNNLQIMASLLRLQAAESNNSEVVKNLNEAVGRIASMAFIHERMYKKESLADIDLQTYLNDLSFSILAQLDNTEHVCVDIKCERLRVNPDAMVSLSLLVNELLTNSVKHAFESGVGIVHMEVMPLEENIKLVYSDNGTWRIPDKVKTFGQELIVTLSEQLEGKIEKTIDLKGTTYSFLFPSHVIVIES
jgi:two-component system, sensor histidine kinase PdtaS